MKRWAAAMAAGLLSLAMLAGCGNRGSEEAAGDGQESGLIGNGAEEAMDWQSQYELGVRLLNEGNYEEAILAFTAAIEIDPNRKELYLFRGDAYAAQETGWSGAFADYMQALNLVHQEYGTAGIALEDRSYTELVSQMVDAGRQYALEYALAEDFESAGAVMQEIYDIFRYCLLSDGERAISGGISREDWQKLRNMVDGRLRRYQNLAQKPQVTLTPGQEETVRQMAAYMEAKEYAALADYAKGRQEEIAELASIFFINDCASIYRDGELFRFAHGDGFVIRRWRDYSEEDEGSPRRELVLFYGSFQEGMPQGGCVCLDVDYGSSFSIADDESRIYGDSLTVTDGPWGEVIDGNSVNDSQVNGQAREERWSNQRRSGDKWPRGEEWLLYEIVEGTYINGVGTGELTITDIDYREGTQETVTIQAENPPENYGSLVNKLWYQAHWGLGW